MLDVRASAQFIADHSQLVSIDQSKVMPVAQKIINKEFAFPVLKNDQQLAGETKEETAMAALLLDSQNFGVEYWTLISSLKKNIAKKKEWLDPLFLSSVRVEDVKDLLSDCEDISFLPERHRAIQELGKGLSSLGKRGAWTLVQASLKNVDKFLDLVLDRFPSFRDEAVFHGEPVGFYKRAQLLVLDSHFMLLANHITAFRDLWKLTAFPDDALPQLLRDEGILAYRDDLAVRVDHQELLAFGSPEEVEIRGNTVQAVELIHGEVVKFQPRRKFTSAQIDTILWTEGERRKATMKPRHRTKTIFY